MKNSFLLKKASKSFEICFDMLLKEWFGHLKDKKTENFFGPGHVYYIEGDYHLVRNGPGMY